MGDSEAGCKEVLEHLYQFLDSEMGDEDCSTIRQHLEICGSCKDRARFEAKVKEIVHTKCCGDEVPEGFIDRLRARMREAEI